MDILSYLETKPEQFIPGKDLAKEVGESERALRDKVKALNLNLLSMGSRRMVVSSNGTPSGYCLTKDPDKIHRYFLQQRALAKGIYDNCIIARAMERRIKAIGRPDKIEIEQISLTL